VAELQLATVAEVQLPHAPQLFGVGSPEQPAAQALAVDTQQHRAYVGEAADSPCACVSTNGMYCTSVPRAAAAVRSSGTCLGSKGVQKRQPSQRAVCAVAWLTHTPPPAPVLPTGASDGGCYSINLQALASGSQGQQRLQQLTGHLAGVLDVSWSPATQQLATGSEVRRLPVCLCVHVQTAYAGWSGLALKL
jgi:hypothetical protein